jgi:hypothetical protein
MRTSGFEQSTEFRDRPEHFRGTAAFRRAAVLAVATTVVLALPACKKNKNGMTAPVVIPTTSRSTVVPTTTSGYVEARTSQIVTDGSPPSAVFDDFTLTGASTIRTVGWQGIYCVQQVNAAAPAPTASAFTVSFYADSSGRPRLGAPLQRTTYPLAQVGQTFEKNQSPLTCGTAAGTTWPFYRYSVTLTTPFAATANTKYWISVQATTPSYSVYWGWRDGTPDNSSSLQLFSGTYTTYAIDRAYSLDP